MPPFSGSRYQNCFALQDANGRWMLSLPESYGYDGSVEVSLKEASSGDTWWGIAEDVYGDDGWKLWKQLMDFQPSRVVDPTVSIPIGQVVYCPSLSFMLQVINRKAD